MGELFDILEENISTKYEDDTLWIKFTDMEFVEMDVHCPRCGNSLGNIKYYTYWTTNFCKKCNFPFQCKINTEVIV